jgi:hypothetical protein
LLRCLLNQAKISKVNTDSYNRDVKTTRLDVAIPFCLFLIGLALGLFFMLLAAIPFCGRNVYHEHFWPLEMAAVLAAPALITIVGFRAFRTSLRQFRSPANRLP